MEPDRRTFMKGLAWTAAVAALGLPAVAHTATRETPQVGGFQFVVEPGHRILITCSPDQANDGIYEVTSVKDGEIVWVKCCEADS